MRAGGGRSRVLALAAACALSLPGCRPGSREPGPASNPDVVVALGSTRKETEMVMDAMFQSAVTSVGAAYLEAERKLREAGPTAEPVLRAKLHDPDPLARLLARTVLDWSEGSAADYQAALAYLEFVPRRAAMTPIGDPSPEGVAAYLSLHFGAKVVDLLALRLVKGTDWEYWRVLGVILYLKAQARPSATEALLRFAAETTDDTWRGFALDAARAARDPDLRAKIEAERLRFQALHRPFPVALVDLAAERP